MKNSEVHISGYKDLALVLLGLLTLTLISVLSGISFRRPSNCLRQGLPGSPLLYAFKV